MNHGDRSYISMATADHKVNMNGSICASLDKYAPLVDTIRGYFVQSLETRICHGLEMFFYNDDENFSTQFIPYVKKCLDVAGNALKYFFRDGIIPCILNTIVLNNRLNKVSRNLDQMGVDRNFLRHIGVQSYIYANEYWLTYGNGDRNDHHHNSNESISFRSSYATNNTIYLDDEFVSTKYSRRTNDDTHRDFTATGQNNITHTRSTANSNKNSLDRSLQMVVRDRKNDKKYHMIELPCNYRRFILHFIESIDSSWNITSADNLNEEFISSINDICIKINEKLEQLDYISLKHCRLYCNIQKDCIYIKLKMMNGHGSKIFLFEDKICHDNNSGKKSNSGRSDELTSDSARLNIKSNAVPERVSEEVNGGRKNSSSTRSSFRTINEYPNPEVNNPRDNNPINNSSAPNDNDDNSSCENNNYEEEYDYGSDCSCTTDSHCWDRESDFPCNLSPNSSYHSARNDSLNSSLGPLYKSTSPSLSRKSLVILSSSTPVDNDLQETSKAEMIDDIKPPLSGQTLNESGKINQKNDSARHDGNVFSGTNISEATKEILDAGSRRVSGESKKSKSVSIQTSNDDESINDQEFYSLASLSREPSSPDMSEVISIVISDGSQSQEVVGLERIDEVEEVDEIDQVAEVELTNYVENIDVKEEIKDEIEMDQIDELKKIEDDEEVREALIAAEDKESVKVTDYQKHVKRESIEPMRESGTQTMFEMIDERMIPIRNDVSDFMADLVTSFVRELDLSGSTSPPPPSLESSEKNSLTKSEEIEIQVASLSSEGIKKIRRVSTEGNFIISPNPGHRWRSSSVFVSPCRHSQRSSASSPMIKCPRNFSGSISNEFSYLGTFQDFEAIFGRPNFYATGDTSMNNLYTVYPRECKPRICQCKKYKKSAAKTTVRLTKKGFKYLSKRFKHYYPTIKKNTKLIMAALSKRLKIIFSKKTFYKLKYFIEEKLIKRIVARERAVSSPRKCVCKMQHQRRTSNTNGTSNNLPIHANINNVTQHKSNHSVHSDKSKSDSQSSLSRHVYPPMKHKISRNYNEVGTNRDSDLLNSCERRRWSNIITDAESRDSKLNNDDIQLCRCPCCCDSIQALNYYQSTENSIYSASDGRPKFLSNNKRAQKKDSNEVFDHKKLRHSRSTSSSLSLSSKENYFCYYHRMFAAKNFNQHSLIDPRYIHHQSISDELDVDCGECFGPTDHNFRLLLNQYMELCGKIKCPAADKRSINSNSSRSMSHRK